jgi:hypothetical protein
MGIEGPINEELESCGLYRIQPWILGTFFSYYQIFGGIPSSYRLRARNVAADASSRCILCARRFVVFSAEARR